MHVQRPHDPLHDDDVQAWRTQRLLAGGFAPEVAAALANDARFDLHALLELVDQDCPPSLAVRILTPLDLEMGE